MTGIRRLAGTTLASAVGVLVLVAMSSMLAGAVEESPLLSLDPVDGPPGSPVGWTATGFADCPPVDDAVSDGVVVLQWDGTDELDRAAVSSDEGTAVSTFLVPDSAELDAHRVTATCLGDGGMTADSQFAVTRPEAVQVSVPNVVGLSEEEARTLLGVEKFPVTVTGGGDVVQSQNPPAGTLVDPGALIALDLGDAPPDTVSVPYLIGLHLTAAQEAIGGAELELGGVSGDRAGLVTDQSPGAGEQVPRGTIVSISLTPGTSLFVRVPDLVGERLDGVPGILVRAGLTLGLVSGEGDVVRSQRPAAGSRVPRSSEVNVSVEPGGQPEDLVPVPDLIGASAADARSALESEGLVLAGSEDADGEVMSQQPIAGTLVPVGSTVSVVLRPDRSPWAVFVIVLVGLGAAAGAAYSPVRRALDRRWIRTHLGIRSGQRLSAAAVADAADEESAPTRVVRVVPRREPDTHVLEDER